MAYIERMQLREELGLGASAVSDDGLLDRCCARAQAFVEAYTRRNFEAVTQTRYFGLEQVEGQVLLLDRDLLTVTTLTNGDSAGTVLASSAYWLLPRNETPKWAIKLKSDYSWEQDTDCEISVAGTWGYSATPPEDIVRACLRLAAYYYRQKDAQVFDVTADLGIGIMTLPKGLPQDVKVILDSYRKLGVA